MSRPSLDHLGASSAILSDFWDLLKQFWTNLGSIWTNLPCLGAISDPFEQNSGYLGLFEAILGTSWDQELFENLCVQICPYPNFAGPCWGPLWRPKSVFLYVFWRSFLGPVFGRFGQQLGPFWVPFWDQIGQRRGQDEHKRAIKSFKAPQNCICK